jgi:hypothetical protein
MTFELLGNKFLISFNKNSEFYLQSNFILLKRFFKISKLESNHEFILLS